MSSFSIQCYISSHMRFIFFHICHFCNLSWYMKRKKLWEENKFHINGSVQERCNSIANVGGGGVFSKVVATFSHVGGSFNLFMATTRDFLIIPSFLLWDDVLHVEHISCVITNCGQHQWVIPSLSITLEALPLDLFLKILLFQVAWLLSLYSFFIAILSPYLLLVGLLL